MDALHKLKGDVQHSVLLAAKSVGYDQYAARQLSSEFFFDCIKDETDPDMMLQKAESFCIQKKLGKPIAPKVVKPQKKKDEQKETDDAFETSFVETDDALYEQIHIKDKRQIGYLRYDKTTSQITDVDEVKHNGITYKPYMGDELDVGAVLLPENTEPYGTTQDLLCEIQQFIAKYVDVPEQYRTYCSYYILLSWVYDRFNTINYLRVRGDLGQGKTRFLQTIGQLCYKPMIISGAIGAAPVFRIISRWNGTLVMDESDFTNSDETAQLVKVLNVGYQKGMSIMRCDKQNPNKLDFFKVFGPKVISSRKVFDDQALESRCLTHEMYRTKRKDIPDTLISEFDKQQTQLRNKLLLYRFHNYMKVDSDKINDIDLGDDIEPRLRQATRSFVALLHDNELLVENFKVFLRAYNKKLITERSTTIDGLIVKGIAILVQLGYVDISSKDIMEGLNETGDLWDRANTRSIGKRLSALGIQTEDRRVGPKGSKSSVRNCIKWDTFDVSIFDRYISDGTFSTTVKEIVSNSLHATKKDPNSVASSICSDDIQDKEQKQPTTETYTSMGVLVPPVASGAGPVTARYKDYWQQDNPKVPSEMKVEEEFITPPEPQIINLPCQYCGAVPSAYFGRKGRPVCELCNKNLEKIPTK